MNIDAVTARIQQIVTMEQQLYNPKSALQVAAGPVRLPVAQPGQPAVVVQVSEGERTVRQGDGCGVTTDGFDGTAQLEMAVTQAGPGQGVAGLQGGRLLEQGHRLLERPSVALASSNQNSNSPGAAAANQQQAKGTVVDTAPKVVPQWPGPGAELGQLARVTITVQKKDDVIKIPTSTVNKINNRTFVLLDDNVRQKPVDIQIGIQTDQETEVLSGLTVGQKVFSRGF